MKLGKCFISLLSLVTSVAFAHESLSFLALGDMPYDAAEKYFVKNVFPQMVDKKKHAFLVDLGDIVSGSTECSDENLTENLSLLRNIYPGKVVYTPGDNEWTDCDRKFPYSELERLDFIRNNLFGEEFFDQKFLKKSKYTSQDEQVENARFRIKGVEFITIHTVGTNNGLAEVKNDAYESALDSYKKRETANLKWIYSGFERLNQKNTKALVIMTQGDMFKDYRIATELLSKKSSLPENVKIEGEEFKITRSNWIESIEFCKANECDGHRVVRNTILDLAKASKKPVLLLHGDTQEYCFEKQAEGIENLYRLNGPGDYLKKKMMTEVTFESGEFKVRELGSDLEFQKKHYGDAGLLEEFNNSSAEMLKESLASKCAYL